MTDALYFHFHSNHTHTYQSINHITCLYVAHHRQCLVLRNNAYEFPTKAPLAANVCSIANDIARKKLPCMNFSIFIEIPQIYTNSMKFRKKKVREEN